MTTYIYKGKDMSGNAVKGTMSADSVATASANLKKQNIILDSIVVKPTIVESIKKIFEPKVEVKLISIFTRQFATMIDAGLPLVQCLEILSSQQENPTFKRALLDIKASVEGGSTFADSLRKHPDIFDNLFVNLIQAGEVGGILDTILNRLSGFMEKAEKLKSQIKSAMSYPMIVILMATLIVTGLLVFIVPTFEEMFKDFGQVLPAPTAVIVAMSKTVRSKWYVVIIVGFILFMLMKQIRKTDKGLEITDRIALKLPVLGDLLRKTAVARFTRTFGTMMASGVPILEALDIVARTAGNKVIEDALLKCKDSLQEGKTLSEPLAETKVFPGMVIQMITVGESTGALDAMLDKIADFYEDEVDAAVSSLTAMIEPLLMAFLGIVVGGLVIALYLPIFQIAGAAAG